VAVKSAHLLLDLHLSQSVCQHCASVALSQDLPGRVAASPDRLRAASWLVEEALALTFVGPVVL
jgi:hypothetical protein